MKEASGEATMTVTTIILIGIVLAVGTPIIQNMMKNAERSTNCANAGGQWKGGKCVDSSGAEITLP